jgi:hypothetical protein
MLQWWRRLLESQLGSSTSWNGISSVVHRLDFLFVCLFVFRCLHALTGRCPQLTNVDFSGCNQLTLAHRCPQLTNVDFSGCNQLTNTSVVALAKSCPLLNIVNFRNCGTAS